MSDNFLNFTHFKKQYGNCFRKPRHNYQPCNDKKKKKNLMQKIVPWANSSY